MKDITNLVWRSLKWRFHHPVTIMMTLIQPLMWLLLFANLFSTSNNNYMSFILAGILVMAILFSSGMSGIANYSTRENGSYYRIMISPVKRISIVIAHMIDAVCLSGIQIMVLLALSFVFGVRSETGIVGILSICVLLVATIAFVSAFSYLLSTVISDENGFIAVVNTFTLPLFFLSTALLAKESMPKSFQIIVSFNPFSYVVDSLRNILNDNAIDWRLYAFSVGMMVILALLVGAITNKKLKKTGIANI